MLKYVTHGDSVRQALSLNWFLSGCVGCLQLKDNKHNKKDHKHGIMHATVASELRAILCLIYLNIDRSHIYLLIFQTIMHAGSLAWSHNWHDHISWERLCNVDHCLPSGEWHQNSLWNAIKCSHILTPSAFIPTLSRFPLWMRRIYMLSSHSVLAT